MFKKYFIVFGLFLAVGFLFFNASSAHAVIRTWDGGGDGVTWTDPLNWGGASNAAYPGQSAADDAVIATSTSATGPHFVYATSTIPYGVNTLKVQNGWTLYVGGANLGASSTVSIIGTSTLALATSTYGSGTLNLGQTDAGIPLTKSANATFTAATGTVAYIGGGTGEIVVASTTFYNLNLTPTSTAAVRTYTMGYRSIDSAEVAQSATTTVSNVFTISMAAKADFQGMADLLLSGSGTVFSKTYGDFIQPSKVVYSSTSATNIATGTYANLELTGAATKTLLGSTTATSTVTIPASGTLDLNGKTFTATGATWTNNGTVSHSTASSDILHASSSHLAATSGGGSTATAFNADALPVVYVTLTDSSLNFDATTADTLTVTVRAVSAITTSQTVTLTETGVKTGIFAGGLSFTLSGTEVTGALAYQGGGTVSYAFTDSLDSTDTGSGSATFTGTMPGGGSSSSSSSGSTATTQTTTTTTTTTETTTATPVETTTTTTTTTAGPTLESVQSKIASAVAAVATLSASPSASDLASIQAQIAAILIDIQALQGTSSMPQGTALGFNFAKGLSSGMTNNDVRNLQTALKTDSLVYPEGVVSGYFGSLTLKAVQRFQEKYGIATQGESGYGYVGPKTRSKLNELYGGK